MTESRTMKADGRHARASVGPLAILACLLAGLVGAPAAGGDDGLVAYWALDEGQGDRANDSGPCANPGVAHNPKWAQGRKGMALTFDGTGNAYVEVPASAALDNLAQITVEAWIRVNTDKVAAQWDRIVSKGDCCGGQHGWMLHLGDFKDGRMRLRFCCEIQSGAGAAAPFSLNTPPLLRPFEWHHAAASFDGKLMVVYLDGEEVARAEHRGQLAPRPEFNLLIAKSYPYSEPFHGEIDEVRVYGRALRKEEILSHAFRTLDIVADKAKAVCNEDVKVEAHLYHVLPEAKTVSIAVLDPKGGILRKSDEAAERDKRIVLTLNTRDLPDGTYAVQGRLLDAAGNVLEEFRREIRLCGHAFSVLQERLESLRAERIVLSSEIRKANAAGADTSLPGVTEVLLEDFIECLSLDLKEMKLEKADFELSYLEKSADRAIGEASGLAGDPTGGARTPAPKMTGLAIRNGFFYAGDDPLVLLGVMSGGKQFVEAFPKLRRYGFNVVEVYDDGPSRVLPAPGKEAKPTLWGCEHRWVLDKALESNLAITVLLPIHGPWHFPNWPFLQDPAMKRCGGNWNCPCTEAPLARQVYERWYRAIIPLMKGHPALLSYDLANEIHYPDHLTHCVYCERAFRDWLKERYSDIAALNRTWKTEYPDLQSVAPPSDRKNAAAWHDWCAFEQWKVLRFFTWAKTVIRKDDPATPMHMETAGYNLQFAFGEPEGIDWEAMGGLFEINGVDGPSGGWHTEERPPYAVSRRFWQTQAMIYDLMKSLAPDKPIVNNEYHIVTQSALAEAPAPCPADYVRTICWLGALHGQAAGTVWNYMREYGYEDFQYNLLDIPEALEALGRTALELRRMAKQIVPFPQATGDMAILYSPPSLLDPKYCEEIRRVYEGACFLDTPVRFVSERQVARGDLVRHRLLVIPNATRVAGPAYEGIVGWVRGGGAALIVGEDSLRFDEHGLPRDRSAILSPDAQPLGQVEGVKTASVGSGRLYLSAASPNADTYWRILDGLLDHVKAAREVRLIGPDGRGVFGVEMRATGSDASRLIYIVNLTTAPVTMRLRCGAPIRSLTDAILSRPIGPDLNVAPLSPMLLEAGLRQ